MEKIEERLLSLKSEIDTAKAERSELVGAEKQHLSQLKEQFGVTNEEAGRKKLAEKLLQKEALESKIRDGFDKLEKEYEW